MTRGGSRVWMWWAALVVYAVVGLAPARGLVLCIGDDGHVALETATSEASCSDCLPQTSATEGCCTNTHGQQSNCSCSDILIFADSPRFVRCLAMDHLDLPVPACDWVNSRQDAAVSSFGALQIRARSSLPPGTRVPTTLILRV